MVSATTVESGAQAGLRGYRLQHLYTLHRLLCSAAPAGLALQLEGTEDVEVFTADGVPLEAVQVKALTSKNVTASTLFSDGGDSFFLRAANRLISHPGLLQKVVSFGPFGPALMGASGPRSPEQRELERFLKSKGLKKSAVDRLLRAICEGRIRFEPASERELETEVMARLKESIASAEPKTAFTYLSGWLYLAMENKERLTAADVKSRVEGVGAFIADEALKKHEWYSNVIPVSEEASASSDIERLSAEFYEGTYTRYQHIRADLDVIRSAKLDRIENAFNRHNVVVVHGASGQGKTALAYRYLRDRALGCWCFEVRLIEDGSHALRVARVLASHARAMGITLLVYLDVAPRNLHWRWLVRELAGTSAVRVLATVREEDWARARMDGMQFEVAEVALDFDESEARNLFDALVKKKPPRQLLNFDHAWAVFRRGGPLMEFAYLVTQSEALRDRLNTQVRTLRNEARTPPEPAGITISSRELELLRRVAVASAYGARLRTEQLATELALPDVAATLEYFEREYLLRQTDGGHLLDGLHPIRSAIVGELLTKGEVQATWVRTASACLSAMEEADLHSFLQQAFSHHPEDGPALLAALDGHRPRSWTGLGGVFHALLWLGVRDFAVACTPLIDEAQSTLGSRCAILLPLDPAGVSARWPDLFPRFEEMEWVPANTKAVLVDLRSRIPSRDMVRKHAATWLLHQPALDPPDTDADWKAAAAVTFWAGYWRIWQGTNARITEPDAEAAWARLPVVTVGDLWLAFFFARQESESDSLMPYHPDHLRRFRRELLVATLEDDGHTVRAHFIISALGPATVKDEDLDENPIHAETMRCLDLLRALMPTRGVYATQGYGHNTALLPLSLDESVKNIPSKNLLPYWLPSLNGLLWRIPDIESRPDSWDEYVRGIHSLRIGLLEFAERLHEAILQYFRRDTLYDVLSGSVDVKHIVVLRTNLQDKPPFPRSAFDETDDEEDGARRAKSKRAARREQYRKALDEYTSSVENFLARLVTVVNLTVGRGRARKPAQQELLRTMALEADYEKSVHLTVHNLHEALSRLRRFQRLFADQFSLFFTGDELERVGRREREALLRLWAVWYQFVTHPGKVSATMGKDARMAFQAPTKEARRRLLREFKSIGVPDTRIFIVSEEVEWQDKGALWIGVDATNAVDIYSAFERALAVVQRVIPPFREMAKLEGYAFSYFWSDIHLIPLFRGKALLRQAARFSVMTIPRPGDEKESRAAKLLLQPLPQGVWEQLRLEVWNLDRIELGRRFRDAFEELRFRLEHMLSLRAMPEPDDVGREIIESYGARQAKLIKHCWERMWAAAREMAVYAEQVFKESQVHRANLALAIRILTEVEPAIAPEVRRSATQPEAELVEAWCARLRGALPSIEASWLLWVADVLEDHTAPAEPTARPHK